MTSFNYYNFTMFAALFYVYLITIMNYGHSLNYCVFVNAVMHVGLWNGGRVKAVFYCIHVNLPIIKRRNIKLTA